MFLLLNLSLLKDNLRLLILVKLSLGALKATLETKFGLGIHKNVKGISKEIYRVMINLRTEDIFFEYERLQALGVKFIRIPEKENWGGWIATFLDPDNNVIQMIQQS